MTQVLIQPASKPDARKHYRDTIEQPVQLALGLHRTQFGRVLSGDIAVFTRDKHVIAAGVIGLKFTSPALGRTLWGEDKKGRVWELMYTLDDITHWS